MSITLNQFIGNKKAVALLRSIIRSPARKLLPHILLVGLKGHGKTTLARLTAKTSGHKIVEVNAGALNNIHDLWSCLKELENDGDILFIDEVHSLKQALQELLYEAMESNVFQRVEGRSSKKQLQDVKLKPWTLIAATTREDLLLGPFLDRFLVKVAMQPYSREEMMEMAEFYFDDYMDYSHPEYYALLSGFAAYSRNIPRVLEHRIELFKRIGLQTLKDFQGLIHNMNIYPLGLEAAEVKILRTLRHCPSLSLTGLASKMSLEKPVVLEYEDFLVQKGFIDISPQGRSLTLDGRRYLKGLDAAEAKPTVPPVAENSPQDGLVIVN